MLKNKLFAILILCLVGLGIARPVLAETQKYAVIVHPIRGEDFWSHPYSVLDTPQKQYQQIQKYNEPATWLVRYDALKSPPVVDFLKGLNKSQEVGLFLEITPSLTTDAQVGYNQSPSWHNAKSVLVIGYSP